MISSVVVSRCNLETKIVFFSAGGAFFSTPFSSVEELPVPYTSLSLNKRLIFEYPFSMAFSMAFWGLSLPSFRFGVLPIPSGGKFSFEKA